MADTTAAAASADTRPRKIIAGADGFGAELKDALISHLQSLDIEVEDLGTSDYYSVGAEVGRRVSAAESDSGTRRLVACGTGVGVGNSGSSRTSSPTCSPGAMHPSQWVHAMWHKCAI